MMGLGWGAGRDWAVSWRLRMKIACDIDEVVVEWVRGYFEFVRKRGVKRVDYEDIFCFDLCEVLGIDKKWSYDLADEFYLTEEFENIDLVEGAVRGVRKLSDEHDFYFITARPKSVFKKTRDFVFGNFGVMGHRVISSGDVFLEQGWTKDKICREMGVDLIIEDNEKYSLVYAKNGLRVLLLDKPWNRGVEHENIFRCMNWDDILKKVEELRNV
jgi:uncharacterized HAD superfamily protein